MHTKTLQEMSPTENLEWRMDQVERALAKSGILISQSLPVVLGRSPRAAPRLALSIAKGDGRWLKLYSRPESKDDVCLESWSLTAEVHPARLPQLELSGKIALTNTILLSPCECWALGDKDVLGQIQVDDVCMIWFGNSGWKEQATIEAINGKTLVLKGRRDFSMPEKQPVNSFNEFRAEEGLQDPSSRVELKRRKDLAGRVILDDFPNGKIGEVILFNGKAPDLSGVRGELYRTISAQCYRYENDSKDGIKMTVELPIRRA